MPATEMRINVDDAGRVNVSGPIENKVIAYGLLELARDVIQQHHANQSQRVVPAAPEDLMALRMAGGQ